MSVTTAVVLARGLGTRMKADAAASGLSDDQAKAADAGAKAMMPLGGRPFLDHVLTALADAGVTDVCLVIGPEHQGVRDYYDSLPMKRLKVGYAVQADPKGTADAVAASETYVAGRPFLAINGDNYYTAEVLAALAQLDGNGLAGYDRTALVDQSNIPAERVAAFALVDATGGRLVDIIEKPAPEVLAAHGEHAMVSMNCFVFTDAIFDACRRIVPSPRGEFEIVDAVRDLVAHDIEVEVVPVAAGVLDLARRGDVASVEAWVSSRAVHL